MNRYFAKILVGLVLIALAGCGAGMQAELDIASGKYEKAAQTYQEYLTNNPGTARDRSRYGFALLKTNRLDESIVQFKKALELKPNDPYTVVYLGIAYLNQGEFDKADMTWRKYRNSEMPLVEKEIKRLLTTVVMAQAQKEAELALAAESKHEKKPHQADTIAVGYFKDISPGQSLRSFQKGLTAILITDISKVSPYKVVEREKLQALLEEMKLGQTGIVNEKTAPRVGRLLRAESMVTGSLSEGSIEAVVGVASTSGAGGKKGSAAGRVEKEKFFELPPILVGHIFKILGVMLTQEQRTAIGMPHTKNYQAFIYYGNCLDALDQGKWKMAKDMCGKALQEDPKFVLAQNAYDSVPGDMAPSIQSIKSLDVPAIAAAVESSLDKVYEEEAEAIKAAEQEEMESGSGGSGGGGGH